MVIPLWKAIWHLLKLNMNIFYSPQIPLLFIVEKLTLKHRRHTHFKIFIVIFWILKIFWIFKNILTMLCLQITEPSTKQRENFKTKRKFSHKNKLGKMGGSTAITWSKTQALSTSDLFPQSQETCCCFNHSIPAQLYPKLEYSSSTCRAVFSFNSLPLAS